jgi:outer membrane biosynthesis protein TonB
MVRFACDRCGKRYAVKGEPAPGRKYRVTCKACGQVILVTGEGTTSLPPEAPASPAHAQATPASELLGQAPAALEPRREPDPFLPPVHPPAPPPGRAAGPNFIDLFGDEGFDDAPPASATDDPPPPAVTHAAPTPPPVKVPVPPRATDDPPPWPSSTRTGGQLRRFAIGVTTAWVLILAAAFGVWLWRRGHSSAQSASAAAVEAGATARAPAPQAPPPAADPTTEPPEPEPAAPPPSLAESTPEPAAPTEPPAAPPVAAPEISPPPAPAPPPAKREPPARVKPPARKPARPEQRAAVHAPPPAAPKAAPTPAPAPESAATAAQPPPSALPLGLTDAEIQKALGSGRSAFQKCLRDPSRGLSDPIGGRQVTLRFNVAPSGEVGYATIDDVVISSAPVGQCLKSAARTLVFPAFRGDPIKVDAPVSIPER